MHYNGDDEVGSSLASPAYLPTFCLEEGLLLVSSSLRMRCTDRARSSCRSLRVLLSSAVPELKEGVKDGRMS